MKPGNVMITEDGEDVKLIDFGIARFYKPGKRRDTIQFGTDGYAPPEQYGKAQTDARADVYALGATLHQLLTLQDPGDQLFHFDPVRRHARSVSSRAADAIAKAVEMNKDRRHQSIDDFWRGLSGREPTWSYVTADEDLSEEALVPDRIAVVEAGAGTNLAFGHVKTGRRITRKLTLPPGEAAKLVAEDDWLRVEPSEVDDDGGEAELTVDTSPLETGRLELQGGLLKRWVSWHTARLVPTKREYQSHIHVEHESGLEDTMAVSVVVTPGALQVVFGWFMTLTAMLVELGLPALTVVALLQ
jgi:serine/threonine protein kinase